MATVFQKPVKWATLVNYPITGDPWGGTSTKVDSTPLSTQGFIPDTRPGAQTFNDLISRLGSAQDASLALQVGNWTYPVLGSTFPVAKMAYTTFGGGNYVRCISNTTHGIQYSIDRVNFIDFGTWATAPTDFAVNNTTGTIIAGTSGGKVYKTAVNSTTITDISTSFPAFNVAKVFYDSVHSVWYALTDSSTTTLARICRSSDDGVTWTNGPVSTGGTIDNTSLIIGSNGLGRVLFSAKTSSTSLFLCIDDGSVNNFTTCALPTTTTPVAGITYSSVWGSWFLLDRTGRVYSSPSGIGSWATGVVTGIPTITGAAAIRAGGTALIVVGTPTAGLIYTSLDGGTTWNSRLEAGDGSGAAVQCTNVNYLKGQFFIGTAKGHMYGLDWNG